MHCSVSKLNYSTKDPEKIYHRNSTIKRSLLIPEITNNNIKTHDMDLLIKKNVHVLCFKGSS